MGIPRQLSDKIFWLQIVDALELELASECVLPATAQCPECGNSRLHILHDHVIGGQWHWCPDCGIHGDMVELAATAWGIEVPAAIAKLNTLGIDTLSTDSDSIDAYMQRHIKSRQRIEESWSRAREDFVGRSETTTKLLRSFTCWNRFKDQEAWKAGPGQIYGVLSMEEASLAVKPHQLPHSSKGQVAVPSGVFKMRGLGKWDDVLTIPHYDMPGRICSFLFIGRQGRPESDWVFKTVLNTSTMHKVWGEEKRSSKLEEAGVAMHPDVFNTCVRYGNRILVTDDLEVAICQQTKQCEQSSIPLPIVSYYPNSKILPTTCWSMFMKQTMVFWAVQKKLNALMVRNAMLSDGLISINGPEGRQELEQYLSRKSPRDRTLTIMRSAAPWPKATAKFFDSLSNSKLENFLMELKLLKVDLSEFYRRLPKSAAKRRVAVLLDTKAVNRTVYLKKRTVVEREDGWYVVGAGLGNYELVMNAQLRIDAAIYQPRAKRTFYQGRLIFQGKAVEFCEEAEQLDKCGYKFLSDLLMEHNLGVLYVDRNWQNRLVDIAKLLHTPELVRSVDTVGWDDDELSFIFPKFRIDYGGSVYRNEQPIFPKDVPGSDLPMPQPLSLNDVWRVLQRGMTMNSVVIGTLAAVLANVMSPIFNESTSGIAITGVSTEDLGLTIAQMASCVPFHVSGYSEAELLECESFHRWPVLIDYDAAHLSKLNTWLYSDKLTKNPRNCIVTLNWYMAKARQLYPGWCVIENHDATRRISKWGKSVLTKIIPAYLKDICKRSLRWHARAPKDNWYERVLEDLCVFLKPDGHNRELFKAVLEVVSPDRGIGYAEAFAELTSDMFRWNQLEFRPGPLRTSKTSKDSSIYRLDEGLAFSKDYFRERMRKNKSPIGTLGEITTALRERGVLVQDAGSFWIVEEKWWQKIAKEMEAQESRMLKAV